MCLGFVCVCVCILGCCFCLCVYIRCVSWQSVPYSWQAFGVLLLSFRCGEKGYQSRKLDQHIHTHTHPAACPHATIIYYSLIVYNGEPFSPHIATWFVPISCLSDLYFDFGWIDHLRVVRTRLTALLYRMGVFFPLSISRTMYIVYCETHSMKEFFFSPHLNWTMCGCGWHWPLTEQTFAFAEFFFLIFFSVRFFPTDIVFILQHIVKLSNTHSHFSSHFDFFSLIV